MLKIKDEKELAKLLRLKETADDSVLLFDIDGTLAPIVGKPGDATVPEATRELLRRAAELFAEVACISGRSAIVAREMVGVEEITYIGCHGSEVLRPGDESAKRLEGITAAHVRHVHRFAIRVHQMLKHLGVTIEDKGHIVALHWREAPDHAAAEAAVMDFVWQAENVGLFTHAGRMVLEIRPPVKFDKGVGVRLLLGTAGRAIGVYFGDDVTDVDAFRALHELKAEHRLAQCLCVGVRSDEMKPELEVHSDIMVDGPDEVVELLELLVA